MVIDNDELQQSSYETSSYKKKKRIKGLSIAVSDLAVLAGYCDYRSPIEVIDKKLLYQGHIDLYRSDIASLQELGYELVDEVSEAELKLSTEAKDIIKKQTDIILNQKVIKSSSVSKSVSEIKKVLQTESQKSTTTIDKKVMQLLETQLTSDIEKEYGNRGEEVILQKYEDEHGVEVGERNSMILLSPVYNKNNAFSIGTSITTTTNNSHDDDDDDKEDTNENNDDDTICFWLKGKVDGVSHQMDCSLEDARLWQPMKVVVEVKSRVNRINNIPPLRDIIQMMSYVQMLDAHAGDLVQAILDGGSDDNTSSTSSSTSSSTASSNNNNNNNSSGRSGSGGGSSVQKMNVFRILSNDPLHKNQFINVVLPLIQYIVTRILEIRCNTSLRLLWLTGEDSDRWSLLLANDNNKYSDNHRDQLKGCVHYRQQNQQNNNEQIIKRIKKSEEIVDLTL